MIYTHTCCLLVVVVVVVHFEWFAREKRPAQ